MSNSTQWTDFVTDIKQAKITLNWEVNSPLNLMLFLGLPCDRDRTLCYPSIITMTSLNRNTFRLTGPLRGESTSHRRTPLAKASDVLFDLHMDKRLSKRSRRRWFETQSRSLRRRCNVYVNSTKMNTFLNTFSETLFGHSDTFEHIWIPHVSNSF